MTQNSRVTFESGGGEILNKGTAVACKVCGGTGYFGGSKIKMRREGGVYSFDMWVKNLRKAEQEPGSGFAMLGRDP